MTICKACGHEAIGQHDCPEAAVARASHGADVMSDRTPNEHAEWLEQQAPSCPPAPQIELDRLRAEKPTVYAPEQEAIRKLLDTAERLRAQRDELLAALEQIADVAPGLRRDIARAAIKKAKEQPKKDTTGM